MSFFDKIKTAVLGNPIFKEYELGKHVCSAGPGLLWRVHDGVKKTTKQVRAVYSTPIIYEIRPRWMCVTICSVVCLLYVLVYRYNYVTEQQKGCTSKCVFVMVGNCSCFVLFTAKSAIAVNQWKYLIIIT